MIKKKQYLNLMEDAVITRETAINEKAPNHDIWIYYEYGHYLEVVLSYVGSSTYPSILYSSIHPTDLMIFIKETQRIRKEEELTTL